jgi:hypothetical protein
MSDAKSSPPGVFFMKQPTAFIALVATGFILSCVLTGLAVNSQERDLCRNSVGESGSCGLVARNPAPSPAVASDNQSGPTLAPPRPEASMTNPLYANEVATGQPVFVKVETDQNEIEVGWETP